MKVLMTEYLRIDLDTEIWQCRVCSHDIGPARSNYKEGLLVYNRNPQDIHPPVIDPEKYEFTFSPDPEWVRILEYYCPQCGTMVETEYTIPGHPPLYDMEVDLDALKAQWSKRDELTEAVVGPDVSPERHHHKH
jgi:acetone carboxylase gamma subunit